MLVSIMINRIKLVLLFILGLFKRAMCCFSRRRKSSCSENLESVNVIIHTNADYSPSKQNNQPERDWNSWDDSPRTIEEHIEQYRQKLVRPATPKDLEPEPDFFTDMAPAIKPQPVYYLGNRSEEHNSNFSRLEAKLDIPVTIAADLEDWNEENPQDGGWEELDTETTKKLIREKRKEMRHQRQTKQSKNSFNQNQIFAERIKNNYS
ncbi:receptor-binding cancer antigen expressed on SiSo cells [Condylostylus longicornis]|uniref:receptor-binding cancer antigen expressed on SiSo cells n=1 Tax=Condylostylus longicornis TaxID=2530218 RepID=UPI00244E4B7F|nr:receptor-binding cancer antigen expressed on SiSo cells [Condylostylus longicornis]